MKRIKQVLTLAVVATVLGVTGCANIFGSSGGGSDAPPLSELASPDGWSTTAPDDYATLEGAFLQSFAMEQETGLDGRSARPLVFQARLASAGWGGADFGGPVPAR